MSRDRNIGFDRKEGAVFRVLELQQPAATTICIEPSLDNRELILWYPWYLMSTAKFS
jgi:hypothetical protein